MSVTVFNKATGETIFYKTDTPEQIMQAWREASETIKLYEQAKDELKKLVPSIVDSKGMFEHDGYMFRVSNVQRSNYDKSVLRRVLDEDAYDEFLEPNKTKIDKFIKENLERLGDASTELRSTMIAVGKPYQVIKLERLK